MKEIKFRAYLEKEECFVYFGLKDISDGYVGSDYVLDKPIDEFTELKDIYKDDIVECPDGWRGRVWWNEEELQWWAKDHALASLNNPKVIGNKFENKDLL